MKACYRYYGGIIYGSDKSNEVDFRYVQKTRGETWMFMVAVKAFKKFDVLGIENNTFLYPEKDLQKILAQYMYKGDGVFENVGRQIFTYKYRTDYESVGAGGVGSVKDYIKSLEVVRTGKIISVEILSKMQEDQLSQQQRQVYWGSQGYGYGLGLRVPRKSYTRTDFGWAARLVRMLRLICKMN